MTEDSARRELADWRRQIDQIDRDLLALLNRRAECVLGLAPLKRQAEIEVFDPERERRVHQNLQATNHGPLSPEAVSRIFDSIMEAMRELQHEEATAD